MKLKILIVTILLIFIVTNMIGCDEGVDGFLSAFADEYVSNGVTYEREGEQYVIKGINDKNNVCETIYILDEINGKKVFALGSRSPILGRTAYLHRSITKRIYFPWSITVVGNNINRSCEIGFENTLQYLISASTSTIIDTLSHIVSKNVIPNIVYQNNIKGDDIKNEYVYLENINLFIPANVSFFFNYENNPNEGYFFIDLLEESGKLTKPPYDPKRDGYSFSGWYKEKECINEWNFDIDEVTIKFDEEGNRIYEEICLYAKWIKQ